MRNKQTEKTWTAEDDAVILESRQEGKSFAQIARLLDRTRNSVAGRCNRLGLCKGSGKRVKMVA